MPRTLTPLLAFLGCCLTASPSIAAEGFYIGSSIGSSLAVGASEGNGRAPNSIGSTSSIFLGHGISYNRIHFGIDGILSFPQNDLRYGGSDGGLADRRLNETGSFSISPRIGIVLVPEVILFASIGYEWSELRSRGEGLPTYNRIGGIRVGLGIDAQVSRHMFIRGEYTHSRLSGNVEDPNRPDVTRGSATLGLGYSF